MYTWKQDAMQDNLPQDFWGRDDIIDQIDDLFDDTQLGVISMDAAREEFRKIMDHYWATRSVDFDAHMDVFHEFMASEMEDMYEINHHWRCGIYTDAEYFAIEAKVHPYVMALEESHRTGN